jgi:hypothetical protein
MVPNKKRYARHNFLFGVFITTPLLFIFTNCNEEFCASAGLMDKNEWLGDVKIVVMGEGSLVIK